ncbi:HamA C-terminal domain-containing protein [Limimonas halophila]|uniref:HamA C-terminal domain-containing protein n=1 Tax=Limimonas halophila TaxID=1082479 RepID=UPI000A7FB544|nr:DUF1837 domain-containing protein [Limimonas halophila]
MTDPKEISNLLHDLARGRAADIESVLKPVTRDDHVYGTRVLTHCHCLQLDGNGRPRVNDLAEKIAHNVIEYCIPRTKINKAYEKMHKYGDASEFVRLTRRATNLFTPLEKSGEGGELLLFTFAERVLKLPQLLCKMDLKTNSNMHIHGADGVHCGVSDDKRRLLLYWGESKIYQDFSTACNDCLESLAKLLLSRSSADGEIARDLQLLSGRLNVANEELELALQSFLDPDEPGWNDTEMSGLCLVGFDYENYPAGPNESTLNDISRQIRQNIPDWKSHISRSADKKHVTEFNIHFILVPLNSAEQFRQSFKRTLGLRNDK